MSTEKSENAIIKKNNSEQEIMEDNTESLIGDRENKEEKECLPREETNEKGNLKITWVTSSLRFFFPHK